MTTTATWTDVVLRFFMVAKIVSLDDPERLIIVFFSPYAHRHLVAVKLEDLNQPKSCAGGFLLLVGLTKPE